MPQQILLLSSFMASTPNEVSQWQFVQWQFVCMILIAFSFAAKRCIQSAQQQLWQHQADCKQTLLLFKQASASADSPSCEFSHTDHCT
jgi:hypothetical protein